MATAWIREYEVVANGNIADEPGTADPTPVTFSTSAASAAFNTKTRYIAITASADYHYKVGGSTVTATTNHLKVYSAAGPLYIGVQPGQYIAFIAAA